MRSRRIAALTGLVAVLGLSSCVIRQGDFTVLSSKLVRLSEFELSKADRTKNVEGESTASIIILFPTGQPTLDDAIDDALAKGNGDVMTDAVVETWMWFIPYVYGRVGWSVRGDVVKTRKN